jgi:hypothetical protein
MVATAQGNTPPSSCGATISVTVIGMSAVWMTGGAMLGPDRRRPVSRRSGLNLS